MSRAAQGLRAWLLQRLTGAGKEPAHRAAILYFSRLENLLTEHLVEHH